MFLRSMKIGDGGGVSVIFALSLVVLLGAAGVGFDFARAKLTKTDLQRSLDAGVLAAAQLYASGSSIEVALASAERAANENAPSQRRAGDNVFRFWREGDAIRGEAQTALPTTLTQVLGFESMDVGATSGATAASNGVELVLVLDVSGSMGSKGKIDAARDAAVGLIDKIYGGNETRPDTYIALAPFSGRVNINGYGRGWMTGAAPSSAAVKLCTGLRATNEENDETPSVEPFPYFTGSTNVCPDYEAIGLSNEKSPVRNAVLALEPGHGTSTNKGLAWGWRMISPKWQGLWGSPGLPLSHAKSPGKVVVLMTDGQNHPNQSGDPYSTAQADAQLLRQCAAMKTEGIRIYTVAFDMGTTLTSLYQECASSDSHHYDAATGEDLQAIFADIGEYLANGDVRLIH